MSKKIFLMLCLVLTLSSAQAGTVEVRANSSGITVRTEQATLSEVLIGIFSELNKRDKTATTFEIDEVLGGKVLTIDFAAENRLELLQQLQKLAVCRMETDYTKDVVKVLPAQPKNPFKTDIYIPR